MLPNSWMDVICDWIYGNRSKSHIESYEIINFKDFKTLQYSSQVTSPAGTRECHNGTPREAPMLRCPAQDLRVTVWITASHASIFSRRQGPHEDQPAPGPAEHSSLYSIVASHLRTNFIRLPVLRLVSPEVALIISSNCPRLLFWNQHGPQHGQIESSLVWQCGILPNFLACIIWAWLNKKKTAETSSSSVGCNLCFELGPKGPGWDFYLNNAENIQTKNMIIIIINIRIV